MTGELHKMLRRALVTTKPELQKLLQQTEDQFQQLERLEQLYHEDEEEDGQVREAFHDLVYELQHTIGKEIPALLEWTEQPVTRPEEARKFVLMRNRIQDLQRFTEIYEGPENFDEFQRLVLPSLQYIHKYWYRLEQYQEIEREISHGDFTLINQYGYQPDEYRSALAVLDRTAEKIKAKGFDELLYGDVVMTTETAFRKQVGSDVIGSYDQSQDRISLAVDYDPDKWSVPVLIHEFGHRLWAILLTPKNQNRYICSFGWVSQQQLKAWWELLVNSGYDLRMALKLIPDPIDQQELKKRWQSAFRVVARYQYMTIKELRQQFLDNQEYWSGLKDAFLDYDNQYSKPKVQRELSSVSSYGYTDPEEDFCETFMFYCMEWDIPEAIETRFLAALGVQT